MEYIEFFNKIKSLNGISGLWIKMLNVLKNLQPEVHENVLNVFTVYFSLLDDGNICMPLDKTMLLEKWQNKWQGLIFSTETEDPEYTEMNFDPIIEDGIKQLLELSDADSNKPKNYNLVTENISDTTKPFFVIEIENTKWLFASKYYFAKCSIEEQVKKLFPDVEEKNISGSEVKDYFKKVSGLDLNEEQIQAIVRGQEENLIITGGPGTGKTTVVCYLLWELLKNPAYENHKIYMAAFSGKAADRLNESVTENLEQLDPEEIKNHQNVYDKIVSTRGSTIHRLLGSRGNSYYFDMNLENQFDPNSIFVIDEASMIDTMLFKNLLEAIPEGAKLFILGDKDQLPSVQAGAVLGELLSQKKNSVVELITSNRFGPDSEVGNLAAAIQKEESIMPLLNFNAWSSKLIKSFDMPLQKGKNPVTYIQLNEKTKMEDVEEIAEKWSENFYVKLAANKEIKTRDLQKTDSKENLEAFEQLNALCSRAKILCAERRGIRGVGFINKTIRSKIISQFKIRQLEQGEYFPGELVMVTENQKMYSLNNGENGIVVTFQDDPHKYLMIKKPAKEEKQQARDFSNAGITRLGNFLFYPMHLLPKHALETSYAITVHKSQGSGYENILVFIPEQKGHPLLNRQIVYTAITRTKGNTYIVSTPEAMCAAKDTLIERFTQIQLQ